MSVELDRLRQQFAWRPIHGCPGRFMLQHPEDAAALVESLAVGTSPRRHRADAAQDPVLVVPIEEGGLIGHLKPDGRTLWSLNDAGGFTRKLMQLGIATP